MILNHGQRYYFSCKQQMIILFFHTLFNFGDSGHPRSWDPTLRREDAKLFLIARKDLQCHCVAMK